MFITSIGPLERDLESQLEDVQMVEVGSTEDREVDVNVGRKDGRSRNDGEVTKQKTRTANLNKDRKNRRRSQAKKDERPRKPIT